MKVTTDSGTQYEFEWSDLSLDTHTRFGKVRKLPEDWTPCNMLNGIEVGSRMVMVLGGDRLSPVRTTSRVTEITA